MYTELPLSRRCHRHSFPHSSRWIWLKSTDSMYKTNVRRLKSGEEQANWLETLRAEEQHSHHFASWNPKFGAEEAGCQKMGTEKVPQIKTAPSSQRSSLARQHFWKTPLGSKYHREHCGPSAPTWAKAEWGTYTPPHQTETRPLNTPWLRYQRRQSLSSPGPDVGSRWGAWDSSLPLPYPPSPCVWGHGRDGPLRARTFTQHPVVMRPLPWQGQGTPCGEPEAPPLPSSDEVHGWQRRPRGEPEFLLPLGRNKVAPPCSPPQRFQRKQTKTEV